jgi:diaminopimelate epimerase
MKFTKAHAYGNDFLYLLEADVSGPLDRLSRRLCDRHTGIGADGLIVYTPTPGGASMRLFNADGSRAEVSGNGVRGLAAILARDDARPDAAVTIDSEGGVKHLVRLERDGSRHLFRAAMGSPVDLREESIDVEGETLRASVMEFGNPQCVVLGTLPDEARFQRLGPAIERHPLFPKRTNVEFASVEAPDRVRILIWERGVGPTEASGTGACAAAVASMEYGGASKDVEVVSPGGAQRVEWTGEGLFLTGWAEIIAEARWIPAVP